MCLEVLQQQMPQGTHILQHAPPAKFLQTVFKSPSEWFGSAAVGCWEI